jgi:hypothetical protein
VVSGGLFSYAVVHVCNYVYVCNLKTTHVIFSYTTIAHMCGIAHIFATALFEQTQLDIHVENVGIYEHVNFQIKICCIFPSIKMIKSHKMIKSR